MIGAGVINTTGRVWTFTGVDRGKDNYILLTFEFDALNDLSAYYTGLDSIQFTIKDGGGNEITDRSVKEVKIIANLQA
jgi:hypothetical protein